MPPKKRKLAAIIKLQIKAGAAKPAPPVGPALGQHGVNIMEFCKAYNAATESQRGQRRAGRDLGVRGPLVHFKLKTPPAARLLLKAAGVEKGSGEPHVQEGRDGDDGPGAPDRADQDARPQRQRHRRRPRRSSPAPPVRWASPSRAERQPRTRGRAGAARTTTDHDENEQHGKRSKAYTARRREDRPRRGSTARSRPPSLAKETSDHEDGRHRRGRRPARRRPPQGRPDGPRHRQPAARHRQDRPRDRVRHRRQGRRGRGRGRRRRWAPRT